MLGTSAFSVRTEFSVGTAGRRLCGRAWHVREEPGWCAGRRRPPACEWQSCVLRCFGTAHSLYPAKICYHYHPCHGVEVEPIRYLRRGGDAPIVIVRLPDGLQLAIPEWMLSSEICERLRTEARPRISLDALIELRTLTDAQHSMVAGDRRGCAESSAGGQDAQPREPGRTSAQASLRRRRALDNISRGGAGTLPRALAGNVGQRSARTRTEAR